ncbi:hypothetical protein SAMN02927923_03262 [Microvirga guangxiensis]|uniref:Uncharacterized protein n=1 Tax=Microvirga guangxiensis TaxID=549386 RepID=A0A1G5KED5_9HYPH|nr:hypothetical protein SAMN02927923_03262 [Microvirga guangxiensis]
MVASNYSAKRSELALSIGPGEKRGKTAAKGAVAGDESKAAGPELTPKPKRKGSAKKDRATK